MDRKAWEGALGIRAGLPGGESQEDGGLSSLSWPPSFNPLSFCQGPPDLLKLNGGSGGLQHPILTGTVIQSSGQAVGARGRGSCPPPSRGPVPTQDVTREKGCKGKRLKERATEICHKQSPASLSLTLGEEASCWERGRKGDPEGTWAPELNFSSKKDRCGQSDNQILKG